MKKGKGCVIRSESLDKNYCQIQGWKNFVHICAMRKASSWGAQNIVHEIDCLAIL